jgi:ATP-binding cassette subfamily B protein
MRIASSRAIRSACASAPADADAHHATQARVGSIRRIGAGAAIAILRLVIEERPKSRDLRPLRRLLPFMRPYLGTLAAAGLALVVAAAATLLLPIAVKFMIDHGFASSEKGAIDRYFAFLFGIAAILALFSALRFYLVSWLGERIVADIRSSVYRHIIRMSPTFFEVTRTGEVLSRLTTDTTLVQTVAGAGLSIALRNALTFAGGLAMLFVTSPRLTTIMLVLIPLVVIPLLVLGRRVRRLSRASQDRVADTSSLAGETLNAIQTVQAFTLEQLQGDRFDRAVDTSFETAVKRIRMRATLTAIAILFVFGAVVVALRAGAESVIAGQMSAGELGQFLLYAIFVAGAAASLSEVWGDVQRAAGATERLMELLDAAPDVRPPAHPVALPEPGRGRIGLERVSFNYPSRPGQAALSDYSLSVSPGERVALVGPSGAGKSTVFQLLLRFYDPAAGRILLDGADIARVHPEAVRNRIAIVPQDTVLFAETAMENIRYGRPDASDEEVCRAARDAAAHEFIERLPQGYATFLGERGARLSGGQRQRVAIARAILKNAPVLLLDEATSALDSQSERLVQEALRRLMQGRTTLVIAHRLATVLEADRIVVMDQGRIVATGRHEELLRRGGVYARLAELQFARNAPAGATDDLRLEAVSGGL